MAKNERLFCLEHSFDRELNPRLEEDLKNPDRHIITVMFRLPSVGTGIMYASFWKADVTVTINGNFIDIRSVK